MIHVDDFSKNHVLTNLVVNENQTFAAYFVNTVDVHSNRDKKEVVLLEIHTLKSKTLEFDFEASDFFFNEGLLILKAVRLDMTRLYTFDLETQVTKELIRLPFELMDTLLGKDHIYFVAEVQKNEKETNVKWSEKGPFYQEGYGIVSESVKGLFKTTYDGKDIKLITSLDMNIDQVDFDRENNRIMFTVFRKKILKPLESDVFTYNMVTEEFEVFTKGNYRISFIKSMTQDSLIFMGVDLNENSRNDNQQIYRIDLDKKSFKPLGEYVDKSNENGTLMTDSAYSTTKPVLKYRNEFYHLRIERDCEMLYKINLDGNITAIETGMKTINSYVVLDDGILIIGLKDLKLHELYWLKSGALKEITTYNHWLQDVNLSSADKINFKVGDMDIDGYVFKPINLNENKSYPGVLLIHGGPKMICSDIFMHDVQLLCANGYFVFCANPKGSDGRGNDFLNIRGRFGEVPYKQLMAFTDKILELHPQLNKEALGVIGGSYGGYMTNYIITRTSRFKAAVSERSISNLMTAFTSSDIGYGFVYEYMGNLDTPWSNPSAYIESSPIMKADKVTTPTLFIHGTNDYRCHFSESLNMFGALNYMGVQSKLCLFEGENHGLPIKGKPQSKKKRYREILNWFENYLKEGDSNEFS